MNTFGYKSAFYINKLKIEEINNQTTCNIIEFHVKN